MYRIRTFNKISPVGLNRLDPALYAVSDSETDEDAILVRSAKLLEHLEQCMEFYQLQPYLRGGIPCKLSEISIDEMVVFRLSEEEHPS